MSKQIRPADLDRFRLEGALGEGADCEVFAATDTHTGKPVVVKRPHPALVSRGHHADVERRTAQLIALRQRLGDILPHLARLIAYAPPASHDVYFGDAPGAEYSVVVEERAKGLPLVGSAIDGIKRKPIGAPQNLFALHPVVCHPHLDRFAIARAVLDIAEAFHNAGALLLDMRPQNIYYDPANAAITLIDAGGVTQERPADRRHPPLDLHDFYLELWKWFIPADEPPTDAARYAEPQGMESTPMFRQNLDAMIRHRQRAQPDGHSQDAALTILHKISERAYPDISAFRADLDGYLTALADKYARLPPDGPEARAWRDAMRLLTDPHWRKFRFHPDSLAAYDSAYGNHA